MYNLDSTVHEKCIDQACISFKLKRMLFRFEIFRYTLSSRRCCLDSKILSGSESQTKCCTFEPSDRICCNHGVKDLGVYFDTTRLRSSY